jgi:hypothetical protein
MVVKQDQLPTADSPEPEHKAKKQKTVNVDSNFVKHDFYEV